MTRRLLATGLTVGAIVLAQKKHEGDYAKHHTPHSAEDYLRHLEDPARDEWQKPGQVVEALGLQPGWTVADIGAGSGYFALRFAPVVGAEGEVLAVDIDPKLLEHVSKRAGEQGFFNVHPIQGAPDNPRLAPQSVNVFFLCDVIHHIEKRQDYYKHMARALRPGGRVAVVDFHKRPLPVGPKPEMKIDREEMIREFESAGFRLAGEHAFLPHQYFLVFEPRR